MLQYVPNLSKLNLCCIIKYFLDNNITKKSIENFSKSMLIIKNLVELDLSCNPIGDDGLQILGNSLTSLADLKTINLSFCGIGEEGIKTFSYDIKPIKHLTSLNLSCIIYLI